MWNRLFSVTISLFLILATACATTIDNRPSPVSKAPGEIIKKYKEIPKPGLPKLEEETSPVYLEGPEAGKLYSLHFENAPLIDVLSTLVKNTGLNLSIEPGLDVSQPIYVQIDNVTLREALDAVVVKGADYSYKLSGNFIEVKRFAEKIYHLDYLGGIRKASTKVGGDILGGGQEEVGISGEFRIDSKHNDEQVDVWRRISGSLNNLKSTSGKVIVNSLAGTVYMIDTPLHIESMVKFLDQLKESMNRQVLIEAKILEVRLSDQYQYGIDWSSMANISHNGQLTFTQTLSQGLSRGGTAVLSGLDTGDFNLDVFIDFLQTQGDVSVLSSPHISVLNGQSAILTVGHQYPYGDISGVDIQDETGNLVYDVDIKRAIVGVQLGVTPHIANNGEIILHVIPTITDLQDVVTVEIPSVGTSVQRIQNPVFDLRELGTVVRVHEGDTVILAGLIRKTLRNMKEKLPILGDIPGLGYLFQNFDKEWRNTELVILLTPIIKRPYASYSTRN